ncbi:MAG: putative lipid II flippase FtsW [Chloroflexota bacterium]|nr:putative lipid II flippase FtsW [Chloroflexota bacterium]
MVVERIALNGTQAPARPATTAPQGHVDTVLVGTLIVLAAFGTLVLFSASYAIGIRDTGDSLYFLKRQAASAVLGIAALLVTARVDYHFWRRWSVPAMVGTGLMLLAVLPLGRTVFGARRWFEVGPVQVQPSEIMKFVLILYMADLLDRKGSRIRHFLNGAIPFAIILGVILFVVMLEPDLGTATVLAVVGISVFLIAGADIRQLGLFLMSGAGAFALLAFTAPYRRERLLLFLHPERDLRDAGWQLWQARIALGDGGIFGLGLGASRQKFSWLPAAHTDAIFAVLGEELGLVGCAVVIGLFAAIAVRGYRTAMRAPDRFGGIMATGITTWLVFQAVINIGGVTTAIPFTGVPLPLFSYGGSSLAVTLGALGVLINISRATGSSKPSPRRAPQGDGRGDD